MSDFWMDDPRGEQKCPRCGRVWPASHMDTDTGDCITCEESEDEAEADEQ